MQTKTAKTLSSISLRAISVLIILTMLLSGVGVTPASAASSVTISGNAGVAGATITANGDSWYGDGSTVSDGSGNYSVTVSTVFNRWSGRVTPSMAGYTFSPSYRTYSGIQTNQANQNFTATAVTYTISGSTGTAGAGATITYTGGSTTANGTTGNYSFTVLSGWTGTVTPSKTGYTFTPASRSYTNVTSNQSNQNYTAAQIGASISGNAGASGVTLSYIDGTPKTATADSSGVYSFIVSSGWSGTVTPSKSGFAFIPGNRTYTNITSAQTGQDYTARPTVFTFASMADGHAETAYFATTVDQISTLNPALVIFNGDLQENGFDLTQLNPMVNALKAENLFNRTFLVRGNADNHSSDSATQWESYFETAPNIKVPPAFVTNQAAIDSASDHLTYSFDYGNSIFIGLDVPGDVNLLTTEELAFLDTRLTYAENQGLTHAFIFFHSAEYPVTSVHSLCSTRTDAYCTPTDLVTVLNNHPIVTATFHGHEHVLSWTHMDNTRVAGLTRSYEQFVTSPSGGASYISYLYPDRVDYAYPDMDNSHGFATISVDGLSFTYKMYKVGTTQPVWSRTFSKLNTEPTISDLPDQTTDEDTATGTIAFTVGDLETPEDFLTVTVTSSNPTLVTSGSISLGGSGANRTLNITPASNQNGSATITVSVMDGSTATSSDTFLLTVEPINDAPVADAQSVKTPWNTAKAITLTGTDVEGSPLSYIIVDDPANGSLSGSGPDRTYTPDTNYSGPDSFTFKVNDGTVDSAPATVSITITAYTISGSTGVAGTTLTYLNGSTETVMADGAGLYSFQVPADWSGTVTPSKDGYTFSPSSMVYANVLADQNAQDYTPAINTYIISGNAGIAGVTLSYTEGTPKTVTADENGLYSFEVPYNWSGMVTPSLTGYGFIPGTRTYTSVMSDQFAQDYSTNTNPTYYVDNTNPNCTDVGQVGSFAVPFCTIERGAYLATAGRTVHVLHGTYAETIFPNSGTAGAPIIFHADSGVTMTGNPAPESLGAAFALGAKSYVVIDGFTITETKYRGIYVDSSDHITISNNNVSYAGIDSGPDKHMQGIFLRNTTYSTVTGNVTHHNSCIGIRLINNSNYNLVSNNIAYANLSSIAYPVVVVSDAAGIDLTGASNNIVINNTTYSNEDSGINVYIDGNGVPSTNNQIIGNLTYENGDHGIDVNNSPNNIIVGNTVHGNGTVGINVEGETGTGSHTTTIANNISAANGFTPPVGSFPGNLRVDSASIAGTTTDYNLFNRGSAIAQIIWNDNSYVSLAAFRAAVPAQEVHGLEADPDFVDPSVSALRQTGVPYEGTEYVGDYYLNPGSPAIDSANSDAPNQPIADIDGNSRIDDPATPDTGAGARTYDDRGAYEFLPLGQSLPVVTTQDVTNITTVTAVGNGTVTATGEPNPTQHGVVWNTTGEPTTADSKTEDGAVSSTGAFTSSITGLTPGTLYYVRAYVTNAVGTVYGEEEVIFTAHQVPTVITQAVTDITLDTARGNGEVTALGVPNPTEHGVVWGTAENPTTEDNKTTDGPLNATGTFTSEITGLTPGTLYHVRAYAVNAAGTSYGEDVTFTAYHEPSVTTQAVTEVTTTTATGNGNITALGVPDPSQHGVVWSTNSDPTIADSKTMDGLVSVTGAFTSAMTGLTPGTLYYVRAYATNGAGTVYGDEVTFTSLLAPTVITLPVDSITTTTASGNGNITDLGTFNPTEHGVVWSTTVNPTTADSKTTDGAVSEIGTFTSAITGLTPGTLYHARAYATSAAGTSYGEDVTFTAHIVPIITTAAVSSIGTTTAIGNGNLTALGTPNPTQHGVVWSISANPTIADNKTMDGDLNITGAFTSSITGLTPGIQYHVRAYATNAAGTSYGEDVVFTTLPSVTGTTTPATFAGTGANINRTGAADWANPGYITADDTSYASATLVGSILTSSYLEGTDYGFAIPTDAAINGIVVTIGRHESGSIAGYFDVRDSVVRLLKAGVLTGNNKAATGTEWPTGSPAPAVYGTTADLWGYNSWTPADINDPDFGVALAVISDVNRIAYVDYVKISVTYTVTVVGSNTTVNCGAGTPLVIYGSDITCVATVVRGSGDKTPSGNVTWTTDGSGTFVTSPCVLSGSAGTSSCSVTYTPAFVGDGSHLITATYAGDPNFFTSNGNQTVTVNQKDASVTPDAASKIYGADDPAFTGTTSGFLPADSVTAVYSRVAGETVAAGPYAISAVLSPVGVLANYNITYNTADFTIDQKVTSVTPNAANKTYGEDDPAFTGTLSGFLPADSVTAVYSRVAGETVAGGPYAISAVLSPAGVLANYNITYNTADFTIDQKVTSVTPNAANKTYGEDDPAFTGTLSGFLPADSVTAVYSRVAGETVAGGPYAISAVLSPAGVLGNYNITYNTAAFTIDQKDASVTPDEASKVYGEDDPAFTGTPSGFLPADSVTAVYSRVAGETVAGGPYAISAVLSPAGVLGNYNITYNTAAFTIDQKDASVTPDEASKVYGEDDPAFTGTPSGFLPADSVTAVYSRVAGETVAGGPYAISAVLSPVGVLGNYNITYNTADFSITAKPITVTADAGQSKVIGTDDPIFTYTSSDPAASFTGELDRESGEDLGSYTITLGTLAVADSNYSMSFVSNDFNIVMDLAYALTLVQDGTTLSGTLDNLTATFPDTIPQLVVDEPYQINSRMSLSSALPAGSKITIVRDGVPEVSDQELTGIGPFWYTDLLGAPLSVSAPFDADYGGASEHYVITISGNTAPIDTELTIESIISRDLFAGEEVVLDTITLHIVQEADIITHSIPLEVGWNLISFNVHPENTGIATVLSSIAGNYNLVYAWDATGAHSTSGNWMKYAPPPAPPFANTLTNLDETMGFWIRMTTADTLEVTGTAPVTTEINLSTNAGGWNLVSYPSVANLTLPGALSNNGVSTDFTLVYAYHADDPTDPWKLFNRTGVPYANDLIQMTSGWGYWVRVTEDHTWSVPYLP